MLLIFNNVTKLLSFKCFYVGVNVKTVTYLINTNVTSLAHNEGTTSNYNPATVKIRKNVALASKAKVEEAISAVAVT